MSDAVAESGVPGTLRGVLETDPGFELALELGARLEGAFEAERLGVPGVEEITRCLAGSDLEREAGGAAALATFFSQSFRSHEAAFSTSNQ
jgi:hypothetical protein